MRSNRITFVFSSRVIVTSRSGSSSASSSRVLALARRPVVVRTLAPVVGVGLDLLAGTGLSDAPPEFHPAGFGLLVPVTVLAADRTEEVLVVPERRPDVARPRRSVVIGRGVVAGRDSVVVLGFVGELDGAVGGVDGVDHRLDDGVEFALAGLAEDDRPAVPGAGCDRGRNHRVFVERRVQRVATEVTRRESVHAHWSRCRDVK
ncbi:hypothetical protein BRC67_05390 [Halobacteriales archaeon QH_3_68_24]|nr:MAG: hypothetical protein BRC67_05390 [Halobacteriales archaeon QH_3_68_24]